MKKRIMLLTTLAAMLAAAIALSGVAQAAPIGGPADAQCAKLAIQTLGPRYNPGTYTFHGGTESTSTTELNDTFDGQATLDPDVFCGFSGNDLINNLNADDIFLGGAGQDTVTNNSGTFYGGEGDDMVAINSSTFFGEEGNDVVIRQFGGTFDGGAGGNDQVLILCGGTISNVERTSGCSPGPGPGPFPGP
jgi:Ca2+-binding RTX toxin-like protein